ncbi:MAG: transposase [Puniceicoccales bacterium]|jgi:hypothetical protein|nr:transposase [Puniceicoccales bacterium]
MEQACPQLGNVTLLLVNFIDYANLKIKPGNLHDVSCVEEVLAGCTGTVISYDGYISTTLRDSLAKKGYTVRCQTSPKHGPKLPGKKKIPKKRSIIETMIGKFKSFFGEILFRFRSPQSAYSAICAAIIAFNLGPLF